MESRPNHPNYSQLGFRAHPPNPPQGGLSCSLLPFAARQKMCVSQQPELSWIAVGLWVLAACAFCLTRSKQGFPTNSWLLAPCQVARKHRKSVFQVWRAGVVQTGQAGQGAGRAGGRTCLAPRGRAGQGTGRAGRGMVSGALGSLGLQGLGFRALGL